MTAARRCGGTNKREKRTAVMTDAQGREAIPEIARMLKDIDVCIFATRGEGGQLHARPMSNNRQVEWDGDSWFFAPSDGRLVAELGTDPTAVNAYKVEDGFGFISVSGRHLDRDRSRAEEAPLARGAGALVPERARGRERHAHPPDARSTSTGGARRATAGGSPRDGRPGLTERPTDRRDGVDPRG